MESISSFILNITHHFMNLLQRILGHKPSTKDNPSDLPYVALNKKTHKDVKKSEPLKPETKRVKSNTDYSNTTISGSAGSTPKTASLTETEKMYLESLKNLVYTKKVPRQKLIDQINSQKFDNISNKRLLELLNSLK